MIGLAWRLERGAPADWKWIVQGVRSKSAAAALQMTIIHDFEKQLINF